MSKQLSLNTNKTVVTEASSNNSKNTYTKATMQAVVINIITHQLAVFWPMTPHQYISRRLQIKILSSNIFLIKHRVTYNPLMISFSRRTPKIKPL